MKSNYLSLIFCIALGVMLAVILFVESKRPIHVHITADEIVEGLCNG